MSSTVSCPRCGHPFGGSQEAGKFVGHTVTDAPNLWVQQEDDVAVIQEEVRRLEGLIHQLNQDRARLLHIVNNIQAATRRLPPEVLSTIFQFARPPIDFDTRSTPSEFHKNTLRPWRETFEEEDFQLVLGAVSHHWRQVVWATPQLWTTISIEVYELAGENMSLLNLYFENSRSLPMIIEFDFRDQLMLMIEDIDSGTWREGEGSISLFESLQDLFFNNAAKIQKCIITGLPIEWTPLINKSFSRCEGMMLCWPLSYSKRLNNDTHLLDLTQLPSLHHFHLKDLHTPFTLLWSAITTLQLDGVPTKQCFESLAKCTNLIKFENSLKIGRPKNSSASHPHPVVLEHLESLTWYAFDDPWSSAFLRHMRFSKLRVLKWSVRPYAGPFLEQFQNDLVTFFSSLPETLQVLELDCIWYGYRIMNALLTSIPHLAEFVLTDRTISALSSSMVTSMIGRPAAGLIEDTEGGVAVDLNQSGGPRVLPRLRKLTMFFNHGNVKPGLHVKMLEALHGARVVQEHFRLELIGSGDIYSWGPEILARLKRLAESGFEFEIFLNSRPLDYMSPSVNVVSGSSLG